MKTKISIIGMGHVGSTVAYDVVRRSLASELVLVDRNPERSTGDASDLSHALSFTDSMMSIRSGELADTADSDLVILTLSVPFSKGMTTRSDLAAGNQALFADVVPKLAAASPNAQFLVVTNPVDTMTWLTVKLAGFPKSRVMGIGTLVDSARFRMELSRHYRVHPTDLRAYVLGEHGDAQFFAMSCASVGGEPITDDTLPQSLLEQAVLAGNRTYKAKGYTNYAISAALTMVIESIVHDRKHTMPLSVWVDDYYGVSDLCLSVPVVVGAAGVERILKPTLDAREIELFQRAAEAIRVTQRKLTQDETSHP